MRIQTLWIGGELSRLEHLCLSSFVYHHPGQVDLYCYDEVGNVPGGVRICDANDIVPASSVFSYFKGSYAGFADLFRWELLLKQGGYWIDTDMLCIRPFDFEQSIVFGKETESYGKTFWSAAVGVLKFPAGHPACRTMVERCLNPHRADRFDRAVQRWKKWYRRNFTRNITPVTWGGAGGPKGFAYAIEQHNLQPYMLDNTVFYPIHGTLWRSPFDATYEGDYHLFQKTRGVHLWNEMLRSNGFDKNAPYQEGSLAAYYEQKYVSAKETARPSLRIYRQEEHQLNDAAREVSSVSRAA
ncbi:capsular polysaccharide synthesis protein [Bremerella cremea]|uniref:capsular polysaccharide synthesis protein n=1 Tax=Bremerella cremea TaxID=1031537 RepID=UPI0031EF1DF5